MNMLSLVSVINRFRGELIDNLESVGYRVPVLIHPTAYISRTAKIEKGTVVEPNAIVKAGATVEEYTKLEAGEVKLGYQKAIVKK